MKTYLLVLLTSITLIGRTQSKVAPVDEAYLTDSVYIENIVEFYTYFDVIKGPQDAVRFKIQITNLGHQPIPNLIRVSNRIEYLDLLYNGEEVIDLNISNGIEVGDWPWVLTHGESDSFYSGYVLEPDSGIFLYEQPLNITWKYMGISSSTEIVDLRNKKVF
jgi:hypothetical protein